MIFQLLLLLTFFNLYNQNSHYELPKYFSDYKIADCKIVRNSEKYDNLTSMGIEDRSSEISTVIHLDTFNETFALILHEDSSFDEINIDQEQSSNTSGNYENGTKYYEGVLKNNALRSYVTGFVHRNLFSGYIVVENVTFFVEPINNYSLSDTNSQKVSIYQGQNVKFSDWHRTSNSFVNISSLLQGRYKFALNMSEEVDFGNQTKDLFCEVEVVADHTLYKVFNQDMQRLKAYIYLHVKYADKVFRKTDFNLDGKPDGIRISVAKISVYKTPHDDNYPMIEAFTLEDYLTKLLYRKQEHPFCLSISMSYLPFEGPAIGQAFKPELNTPNFFTGICENPVQDLDDNDTLLHFNVAAVNLRISTLPLLPLAITTVAFTHEIGHAFGSDHDPTLPHICSPTKGKYLMYPRTIQAPLQQRSEFSPCSRLAMAKIIRLKGDCLKSRNATCGNAIREDGEECDCGTKITCRTIDRCCTPSDAEPPEVGCTLRKNNNFECSPKEQSCCTENCTTSDDTGLLCYKDSFLCLKSFCDGVKPDCPEPETNSAICPTIAMECNGTICNSSVCWELGLQECFCDDEDNECHICCQQDEKCVPTSSLELFNGSSTPYVHEEGTPCSNGTSKCDGKGICVKERKKKHRKMRRLWMLMLVVLFAVAAFGLTLLIMRKQMNPRQLLLLRNRF